MKTQSYIDALVKRDRQAWINEHRTFIAAIRFLEETYAVTIEKRPKDTVRAFVDAIGSDLAAAVIATLVNRNSWDGRISRRNAEWALSVDDAFDDETATCHMYHTNRIHMAHLDQLADVMRKGTWHEAD